MFWPHDMFHGSWTSGQSPRASMYVSPLYVTRAARPVSHERGPNGNTSPTNRRSKRVYLETIPQRRVCFTICLTLWVCFTICMFISPDLDGHRAPKSRALTLRDPENCKVSKPKYEATALCSHRSIGYPNSTNFYSTFRGKCFFIKLFFFQRSHHLSHQESKERRMALKTLAWVCPSESAPLELKEIEIPPLQPNQVS